MKKEAIEFIVETYNLPRKKRDKIISVASQRAEKFSLENFEEIYADISFLIEKFYQTPYQERFFVRLDNLIKEESKNQFHEITQILKYQENNSQWLKEKLKKLTSKQKEPLVILGRKVIQIEPFIKLGRRTYNKEYTPLDLYESHPEVYARKSRTGLFQFDSGLYESLRRWNQLEIAIPNIKDTKFKGISQEKQKEIIKELKICKSPTKVARKLNVSRATVDYYGAKHKVRTPRKNAGTPGYPKQMIEDIVECLKKCKKASKVAECYGVSIFTVTKHGRKAGVPILPRGGNIENILKNKASRKKKE